MINLYRVVQREERADIEATGQFRTAPITIRAKQFWHSEADAARFARLIGRTGARPSWIVAVEFDVDADDPRLELRYLDSRSARHVAERDLEWLNGRITSIVIGEELP